MPVNTAVDRFCGILNEWFNIVFRFYTYGNFPLEEHLQRIDEQVLSQFQRASAETSVPCEPRWQTPVMAVIVIMIRTTK